MKLEVAAVTNPGLVRQINEDNVWSQVFASSDGETIGLFVVCDGMGGHLGGEVASHWAIEAIKREFADFFCPGDPRATVMIPMGEIEVRYPEDGHRKNSVFKKLDELVLNAVEKANRVVYEYAQQKPQKAADAGTTVTMAVTRGKQAVIANVGDSRTYVLREGKLRQITRDHSLVANMVENGQLKPKDIFHHPQRNVIYRSLGQKNNVKVDTFHQDLKSGDYILLCSDGLWEMVHEDEIIIGLIQGANNLDQACKDLLEAANQAGGEDNIGIVLVKVA